ncbi:GIY-YIG nuclease family protein [Lysinibacillus sp. FSL M8-0355]|uniref:GIY-YIG nuclease family protein n=1 Tax=Lysinibacillus sp. FSL M8-0355 TaxID=2921719 RepID=UPI0030F615BB
MEHELLNRGIYAIINKQLNMVYVGETQRNFLIRWVEHLMSITKYEDQPKRIHLYLNQATKFIVLKKMDSDEHSTKDFYKFEYDAQNFYIQKGWDVLSSVRYNPNRSYSDCELTSEKLLGRYRKAVKHMAYILSTVNTKHKNGSFILSNLYKKVEKHFEADFQSREGKNTLHKLNLEELEFIMFELYPRYYHKRLDTLRNEYKNIEIPKTLFDFIE